jgi:DNA-directed RNA polymerase specialized sigma24 family protein
MPNRGSWDELWCLMEADALGPIRGLVAGRRLDPGLADDLGRELLVYLWEHRAALLRGFRGAGDGPFRAYVWGITFRSARKRLARRGLASNREAEARRAAAPPDRSGPTKAQVLTAIAEAMACMTEILPEQYVSRRPGPAYGRFSGPGAPRFAPRRRLLSCDGLLQ